MNEESRKRFNMAKQIADNILYNFNTNNLEILSIITFGISEDVTDYHIPLLKLLCIFSSEIVPTDLITILEKQYEARIEDNTIYLNYQAFDIQLNHTCINTLTSHIDKFFKEKKYDNHEPIQNLFSSIIYGTPMFGYNIYGTLKSILMQYPESYTHHILKEIISTPIISEKLALHTLYTQSFEDFLCRAIFPLRNLILRLLFTLNKTYYPEKEEFQNVFSVSFPQMDYQIPDFRLRWYWIQENLGSKPETTLKQLYQLWRQLEETMDRKFPQLLIKQ